MGLQKVAFNFMVERGGKLAKSLLCSKPPKLALNIKGLKYVPEKIKNFETGMIKNLKTGKQEPIIMDVVDNIPKTGKHVDISAFNITGEEIGLVRLKDDPSNEFKRFMGITGQDCLYIDYWATSPQYKGIGKEMLKKIVQISKQCGYEGRVSLQACTGSIPSKFMKICGYGKAQDASCAIKYKKMGFNATTPEMDLKISEAVANGENGLVIDPSKINLNGYMKDSLSCKMELSLDTIKRYLHLETLG